MKPLTPARLTPPNRSPCLTHPDFPPFCLQPPHASRDGFLMLPLSLTGVSVPLTGTSIRASPFPSRLANFMRPNRVRFLRTGGSPSVASHPALGDAVTFGYRPESICLKRTFTSLSGCARRRTRGQPVADPNRTSSTTFTSVASVLPSQPGLFTGCRREAAEAPAGVRCATSRPRPPQAYSCSKPRRSRGTRLRVGGTRLGVAQSRRRIPPLQQTACD